MRTSATSAVPSDTSTRLISRISADCIYLLSPIIRAVAGTLHNRCILEMGALPHLVPQLMFVHLTCFVGSEDAAYRHPRSAPATGITSTGLTTDPSLEAANARSISAKG